METLASNLDSLVPENAGRVVAAFFAVAAIKVLFGLASEMKKAKATEKSSLAHSVPAIAGYAIAFFAIVACSFAIAGAGSIEGAVILLAAALFFRLLVEHTVSVATLAAQAARFRREQNDKLNGLATQAASVRRMQDAHDTKLDVFGDLLDMSIANTVLYMSKTGKKLHRDDQCSANLEEVGVPKTLMVFLQRSGSLCTMCSAGAGAQA